MTISRHLASSKAGNRSFYTHIHKNTLAAKKRVEYVFLQHTILQLFKVKESTLKDKLDQMEYTFDKKRAQKCRCLLAARVK
jgi:hypothetical protein